MRNQSRLFVGIVALVLTGFLAACDSVEERAEKHYQNGLKLAEEGESAKARLEFQNAVKLDDTLTGAWFGLAEHFDEAGDFQSAAGRYLKVLELDPDNSASAKRVSEILLLAGNLDEALKYNDIALDTLPDNIEVIATRAIILFRQKDTETAVEFANKALELDPLNENATLVIIGDKILSGERSGALQMVNTYLAEEPKTLSVNLVKLDLLNQLGDEDGVRDQLLSLIEHYPKQANFRASLASWYRERGQIEEAINQIRSIVEQDPTNERNGLALIRYVDEQKGREAALEELDRLIALHEGEPNIQFPYQRAKSVFIFADDQKDAARDILNSVLSGDASDENKARAKIQLANFAMTQDDSDTALSLIQEVLDEDNSNIDALVLRARVYGSQDRYDEALLDVRAALNEAPENVAVLELAANVYRRLGNISLVGDSYSSALEASRYNPGVAIRYARFLTETDNARSAEIVLSDAARRHPRNTRLLSQLSQVRMQLEDFDGAREVAQQLARIEDGATLSNRILANLTSRENNFDETINLLAESREAGDTSNANMRALVDAYIKSGETETAREFLNTQLAENADNLFAKLLLAAVDLQEGESDAAVARLEEVISASQNSPAGYLALARYYFQAGETEKWQEIYERAQENVEDRLRGELDFIYAQQLERTGDIDGSIAIYEKLYTSGRNSDMIANNYASLLSDHKADQPELVEKATVIARRLRGSAIPQYRDTYAWTLYLAGEYQQALQELLPAVEKAPENPYIQYHIGMTYVKLGLPDRAKPHLEEALKRAGENIPFIPVVQSTLADIASAGSQAPDQSSVSGN